MPERGVALLERLARRGGSPNSTLGDGRAEQSRAGPVRGDRSGADDAIGEGFLLLDMVALSKRRPWPENSRGPLL